MSESIVSIFNSTTTPLDSRKTFIGQAERCIQFKNIGIYIATSHPSSPDGFQIQFSSNGSDWDIAHTFSVKSIDGVYYNFPVEAQYFRVLYTNGANLQTYFRLQSMMHLEMTKEATHRLNDVISGESAVELSRAFITGKRPDGEYTSISVDDNGLLNVNITGRNISLLSDILLELQKLNCYMSIVTGEQIKEEDTVHRKE